MTDTTKFRAFAVYAFVVPIAIVVGFLLSSPTEFTSWAPLTLFLLLLSLPLILKWHRPLLFLSWNMTAVVFFLPGSPPVWMLMAFITLIIALVQRTLVREMRFIYAPSITLPLLYLGLVVYVTAKMTGGYGMATFGSSLVGGHRYFIIFGGIAGCLAMITQRIPHHKALLYVGLFFLGALTDAIGNTINFATPSFYYLFLIFPADVMPGVSDSWGTGMIRFFGTSIALMGAFWYILARFGIRGLLGGRNIRRLALAFVLVVLTTFGGFRSCFVLMAMTVVIMFYLEGLFRSKYAVPVVLSCLLVTISIIPLANKLPLSIQRTLSVLPLNVDPVARMDAQASTEWRLEMWNGLWPQVPNYLWLGKGLLMESSDLDLAQFGERRGLEDHSAGASTASDYHNGPLTTIIPFGIWGAIGWLWFLGASIRAFYFNFRFGEEHLKRINTLLLAYLVSRTILFFFVFGNFYSDVPLFAGLVGLNLAINGGIRRPLKVHTIVKPVTLQIPAAFKPAHSLPHGRSV